VKKSTKEKTTGDKKFAFNQASARRLAAEVNTVLRNIALRYGLQLKDEGATLSTDGKIIGMTHTFFALPDSKPTGRSAREIAEIENKVRSLVDKLGALTFATGAEYFVQKDRILSELREISDEQPDGIAAGKILSFQVADGYAMYVIMDDDYGQDKIRMLHVPAGDCYRWNGMLHGDYIQREHALSRLAQMRAMSRLISSKKPK
jgi:hypothetical protein